MISPPATHFNPVPSLLTLCNALCGFTAVLYTFSAAPEDPIPVMALWLVFGAMIFDVLDGLSARLLKAQSLHGMNLDSLADALSFGVAPAAILYRLLAGEMTNASHLPNLPWVAAAFYLACALWRLAHYNALALQETDDDSGDFVGLPSPGAAALICAAAILVPALGLDTHITIALYTLYATGSAVLMVSAVPYTHLRRHLAHSRRWITPLLVTGCVASIIVLKVWAMVGWAHLYAFYAPLIALESHIMQRREADADSAP